MEEKILAVKHKGQSIQLKVSTKNTTESISKAIERPVFLVADEDGSVKELEGGKLTSGSYTLKVTKDEIEQKCDALRQKNQAFLKRCKLASFPKPEHVIYIPMSATISEAVGILTKNNILAAPVEKAKEGKWVDRWAGQISMLDILLFVCGSVEKNEKSLTQAARKFDSVPVAELVDQFVTPFLPWPLEESNLLEVMWIMNQKNQQHVYRVMIIDAKKNELCSVITQNQICHFIGSNLSKFQQMADMTVQDLRLGQEKVVCVRDTDTPLDAFKLIRANKISAVPVIGVEGLIVGTITVKDSAQMVRQGHPEALMQAIRPIHEFLRTISSGSLRTVPIAVLVKESDTLRVVIEKLVKNQIHRVWVEGSKDLQHIGVISMTDVIKVIAGEGPAE